MVISYESEKSWWDRYERAKAAEIIGRLVPQGRWAAVTGHIHCPQCDYPIHAYHQVDQDDETGRWIAYECLRCCATHLLGDRMGTL